MLQFSGFIDVSVQPLCCRIYSHGFSVRLYFILVADADGQITIWQHGKRRALGADHDFCGSVCFCYLVSHDISWPFARV